MRVLFANCLHLGCRPTYKMRDYLHMRFEGIVRKPFLRMYKDGPILKVCISGGVLSFAAGVQAPQIHRVIQLPG